MHVGVLMEKIQRMV